MNRSSALVGAGLAVLLFGTACSGSSGRSVGVAGNGRFAVGGTFTMALTDDPGGFDPYRNVIFNAARLAYDSLVNQRPDGVFVSGLAEKWTSDAHKATFTMRRDVTCSDGTPLTPRQVADALNFIGDPKNKSPQYGVNTPTAPFTATGDDRTGTVRVMMDKEPFGFLLNTVGLAPIVCAKGLRNPKTLANASDGTGPFVLTSVVPGASFTLTVRKGYAWGPGGSGTTAAGTPAKVVLKVIPSETTAANLLLSGQINMALVGGQDHVRLDARGLRRLEVPTSGAGLRFNQRDGHLTADRRVRQALVQALDLNQVIKVSTGGFGGPATGLVLNEPRACPGSTVAGQLPSHDAAAAGSLLDAAGWTKGADGVRVNNGKPLSIDLHFSPAQSSLNKPTAELIAAQWKAIGVKVKLSADTLLSAGKVLYETGNWDVVTALGNAYLPSAWVPYVSGPFPPKGTNLGGMNKDYDGLVAKAKALTGQQACTYWNQAEQALYRHLDIVPISNRPRLYYLSRAQARTAGYEIPIPTSIRVLD